MPDAIELTPLRAVGDAVAETVAGRPRSLHRKIFWAVLLLTFAAGNIAIVLLALDPTIYDSGTNANHHYPTPPVPDVPAVGDHGIPITLQLNGSAQVINLSSRNPLYLFLSYAQPPALDAPPEKWSVWRHAGEIFLSQPILYENGTPNEPTDAGAGTFQLLQLGPNAMAELVIPEFKRGQAWIIRPVGKEDKTNKFCHTGGGGGCGMPAFTECGKDMVCDLSVVDGMTLRIFQQYTRDGDGAPIFSNVVGNPCVATNTPRPTGCVNPSVNGQFPAGKSWNSEPCPAGTCNLIGQSRAWAAAIMEGQCYDIDVQKTDGKYPDTCTDAKQFVAYTYSHSDWGQRNLGTPYKLKVVYRDMVV